MKIGFIGGGKMAEAMVDSLIARKVAVPRAVTVSDISAARRRALKKRYGVAVTGSNAEAVRVSDVIVLAVKPQDLAGVLAGLAACPALRGLVISIAAGKTLAFLQAALPGARVIRVMPNLACQVSEGMSVFCAGRRATASDRRTAARVLGAMGQVIELPESRFDAVTALSGSGPAFLAYALDALVEGAVEQGLERRDAALLACQTMLGTGLVLIRKGLRPSELIAAVASPNGTTAAGLAVLEKSALRRTLARTVRAAARRSRELSR